MSAIPEQTTEQGPIQLAWNGPNAVVAPDDQKRFVQQSSWSGMAYPIDLAAERFGSSSATSFWSQFINGAKSTRTVWRRAM